MRLSAFARMNVVQKEEKESRLTDFISRNLAARKLLDTRAEKTIYRVVALSPDSPVSIALARHAHEAEALGIEIQAVYLRKQSPTSTTTDLLPAHACRFVSDARLLDAHEQLVLGPTTAWLGDCMRREPAKRDAFECYSEGCDATARRALNSFDRLWSIGKSGSMSNGIRPHLGGPAQALLEASLIANSEMDIVTYSLRH